MAVEAIRGFFGFLAKLGLSVRDDPKKVIQLEGREWGHVVDGLILSIADDGETISVVLRNVGVETRTMRVPDFATWFRLNIEAQPTPFGKQLMRPGRETQVRNLSLAAGEPVEALLPIGSLFQLRNGTYEVTAACALENGAVLNSNRITVRR